MNVIYKTIPVHTAQKVTLDQVIEVFFMVDINKQTIRPEHLVLLNISERKVEDVEFEYSRRVLKVKPVNKLSPLTHYQLQIVGGTDGIKDITGRSMAQTYEIEFYTKDMESVKPPKVLSPTDKSIVSSAVTVQLEQSQHAFYYELQISKSNTFQNVLWPINGEKIYRMTDIKVTPDIKYETGSYYMRVRAVSDDGEVSAWSPTIRFYYNGTVEIEVPKDEEVPVEVPKDPPVTEPIPDPVPEVNEEDVVLQTKSRIIEQPTQLSQLQDHFVQVVAAASNSLSVTSVSVQNKSVNNKLTSVKQITVDFNEDIAPETSTNNTCYVLVERN